MNPKLLKLIRLLMDSSPSTAAVLADQMGVSVRSIKNYVRDIHIENPNIIQSSNEGYSINIENAKILLEENNEHIPQTSAERVTFIIARLLHHNNSQAIDIYDLSDEIFVSLSTLKNELTKVKRKLKKFDLELISKKDTIQVIGLEKNKRKNAFYSPIR